MAKQIPIAPWQRAIIVLTSTVVACVVVLGLYWARPVLVPIVLAVFLTPVLGPVVTRLERRRIPRVPAVLFVVGCAAACVIGILWLMTKQISTVAGDLPAYSTNIKEKINAVRKTFDNPLTQRLQKMVEDISNDLNTQPGAASSAPSKSQQGPVAEQPAVENPPPSQTAESQDRSIQGTGIPNPSRKAESSTVIMQRETPLWLSWLPSLLGSLMDLLGGVFLSLLLVVFMLLRREDLRNRVIRLLGHGRVTVTTKAVDDAGKRISRFLATQLIVNSIYGLVIGIGLWAIGVQSPLLWGFLTAALRYLPYIGVWIAALPPILLSIGMFPGWLQPSLVVALFFAMEMISGNFLEPKLYGHSIGVSEVALLIVASCWAFLWGPIGLLLSSPLTVCLVVLGKYVPSLQFLDVLLGDEPALEPEVSFYQRLLGRDQDEAMNLALAQAKESPNRICDSLLLPTLVQARYDFEQGELTADDEEFIRAAIEQIMDEVEQRHDNEAEKAAQAQAIADAADDKPVAEKLAKTKLRIVGCASRNPEDVLALQMLRRMLDPDLWDLEILSTEILSSEVVDSVAEKNPPLVIVGALPPGGLTAARYLSKRLRDRAPKTRILVGRWGILDNVEQNRQRLRDAGADQVDTTLGETCDHLRAWRPVFVFQQSNVEPPAARESIAIPATSLPTPAA